MDHDGESILVTQLRDSHSTSGGVTNRAHKDRLTGLCIDILHKPAWRWETAASHEPTMQPFCSFGGQTQLRITLIHSLLGVGPLELLQGLH